METQKPDKNMNTSVVTPVPPVVTSPPPPPSSSPVPETKSNTLLYLLVAFVALILIGAGLLFLTTRQKISMVDEQSIVPTASISPTVSLEPVLSTSDEIDVLEKEINATDVSNIDTELKEIDQESGSL